MGEREEESIEARRHNNRSIIRKECGMLGKENGVGNRRTKLIPP